jgi:hypothetical protein
MRAENTSRSLDFSCRREGGKISKANPTLKSVIGKKDPSSSLVPGSAHEGFEDDNPCKELEFQRREYCVSLSTGTVILARTSRLLKMIFSGGLSTS